jgi:hypothetical protein
MPEESCDMIQYISRSTNRVFLLFNVIRRVRKYSGIEAPGNTVATFDHYTMLVSLDKIVIEEGFPLLVEHLTMTMSHERFVGTLASRVFSGKIFERSWQLEKVMS